MTPEGRRREEALIREKIASLESWLARAAAVKPAPAEEGKLNYHRAVVEAELNHLRNQLKVLAAGM